MAGAPRRLVRLLQRLVPAREDGVTVLAYHLVGAGTAAPVDLPADRFRPQMEELRERAEVLPLRDALARLEEGRPATGQQVVLTFDDAFDNFHRRAWPVLAELALPATLFVPVGFVERERGSPLSGAESLPPLSWPQLAEMTATGLLAIGSHSWSHPDLRRVPDAQLGRELDGSRRRLEERLGVPVDTFCYPRGLWNRRVEARVRQSYAWAAVGGGRRLTARALDHRRICRLPLRRDMEESLAPSLATSVWLEEWLADKTRRYGSMRWMRPS